GLTAPLQSIEAEIERDPVQPGGEASGGTPRRGVRPDACEGLLRHVLGVTRAAEDSTGERDDAPQMPLDQETARVTVASADASHESLIRASHRLGVRPASRRRRS